MIIHIEQRELARNRLRFYAITVTRTLFDGWAVVRERCGRRVSKRKPPPSKQVRESASGKRNATIGPLANNSA